MKESIKRLREAREVYQQALQVRYDELAGYRIGTISLEEHKKITSRIDLEESAPEMESAYIRGAFRKPVSVSAYIKDDMLYWISYHDDKAPTHTKLFDLS